MRTRTSVAAALACCAAAAALVSCHDGNTVFGATVTGADPLRGPAAIYKYGCGSCHTIGGISDARGLVGPPLTGIRDRMYVAGVLRNTPDNIVTWIRNPKAVNDKTAMPTLGVSPRDAADIAAYLYSLR